MFVYSLTIRCFQENSPENMLARIVIKEIEKESEMDWFK